MSRYGVKDRTQIVPFAEASDFHFRIARSFALLTDWAAALAGRYPVQDIVAIMTRQVQAANIALYRFEDDRPQHIAVTSRAFGDRAPKPSSGAIARLLRARPLDELVPGSIWRASALHELDGYAGSDAEREWSARDGVVETSLIILEATEERLDCLEILFDAPPDRSPELPASLITQALANAWEARAPGLMSRCIAENRRRNGSRAPVEGSGILSMDNPCGLSRAEQRICHLVATGAKAKAVAEALNVSIATVRTHLRNLYAKTGASGQVELLAMLAGSDPAVPPQPGAPSAGFASRAGAAFGGLSA